MGFCDYSTCLANSAFTIHPSLSPVTKKRGISLNIIIGAVLWSTPATLHYTLVEFIHLTKLKQSTSIVPCVLSSSSANVFRYLRRVVVLIYIIGSPQRPLGELYIRAVQLKAVSITDPSHPLHRQVLNAEMFIEHQSPCKSLWNKSAISQQIDIVIKFEEIHARNIIEDIQFSTNF